MLGMIRRVLFCCMDAMWATLDAALAAEWALPEGCVGDDRRHGDHHVHAQRCGPCYTNLPNVY